VDLRARQVLDEAVALLSRICSDGLLNAIADGTFGITRRPADGGRGLDGVIEKADGYVNPAVDQLEAGPGGEAPPAASSNGSATRNGTAREASAAGARR
jgi:beta-lysine 5,6-aminomutase alpha subunit